MVEGIGGSARLAHGALARSVALVTASHWLIVATYILLTSSDSDDLLGGLIILFMGIPTCAAINVAISHALSVAGLSLIPIPRRIVPYIPVALLVALVVTSLVAVANVWLEQPRNLSPYFDSPPPPLSTKIDRSFSEWWPWYCLDAIAGAAAYRFFCRRAWKGAS